MIYHRKAKERGHLNFGWLDTYHTFSFGSYFDPKHMGFRNLRVINDDTIQGGSGFETHPHKNMEIVTFVTRGALEHKDTLGNQSVIRPGEIQVMSAGTGALHSEYNHYADQETSFFQIWLEPKEKNIEPRYDQRSYEKRKARNELTLLVSPEGGGEVAAINSDALLYLGEWESNRQMDIELDPNRSYWLQMIGGRIKWENIVLEREDGLGLEKELVFKAKALENSQFLLFNLK